jgi:hypothetical protein
MRNGVVHYSPIEAQSSWWAQRITRSAWPSTCAAIRQEPAPNRRPKSRPSSRCPQMDPSTAGAGRRSAEARRRAGAHHCGASGHSQRAWPNRPGGAAHGRIELRRMRRGPSRVGMLVARGSSRRTSTIGPAFCVLECAEQMPVRRCLCSRLSTELKLMPPNSRSGGVLCV